MRKALLSTVVLTLLLTLAPANGLADTTEDCDRVAAYVSRVEALIDRAAPAILRSGNERAIAFLNSAVDEIRIAGRARRGGMCRAAYNHAQQAEQFIRRALRLIHQRRAE